MKSIFFIAIWSINLSNIVTLITFISAAFTIALRDIIFNFFCGMYISIKRPFSVEDRIEFDDIKID